MLELQKELQKYVITIFRKYLLVYIQMQLQNLPEEKIKFKLSLIYILFVTKLFKFFCSNFFKI